MRFTRKSSLLRAGLLVGCLAVAGCSKRPADGAGDAAVAEYALREGWQHYGEGAFDTAANDFERAVGAAASQAGPRQAALYASGLLWDLRRPGEDVQRAAGYYKEALETDPRGELAPWLLLAQARQNHTAATAETNLPAVRESYERVVAAFPDDPAAEEAFLFEQTTFLVNRDPAPAGRALEALTRFVESHPRSPLTASAWDLIARAQDILGHPAERLAASLRALETSEADPANPRTDRAAILWALAAQAEFDVGDFAAARRLLRRLLEEYPTDDRGYGAHLALARMDAVEDRLRAGASVDDVRRVLDPARP